ncbi:MAG: twin-arginine translocation signal domain-containing protein, partial [Rhodospirillales bacterium]|nr:twin-arginine translocation signal domain-containing protein [Rhodospirillales bacterium]
MTTMRTTLNSAMELSRLSMLSRRGFLAGSAALGALVGWGLRSNPAAAKTTMTWMGWQGYETP